MYGSLTFIVRAIDIKSYGHILPRAVTSFLSWSCTDSIVTILYVVISLFQALGHAKLLSFLTWLAAQCRWYTGSVSFKKRK